MNIIHIEQCPSTNIYLKELNQERKLDEGSLVLTANQTNGRGQRTNRWESQTGKNITCSLLLYPDFLPLDRFFLLSETISLAIKDTLDTYVDDISIKWPNDIYFQDKKICGILIENELTDNRYSQSIVGIGLNVNQEIFMSNAPNPVSLKQITGEDFNLDSLVSEMLKNCLSWYEKLKLDQTPLIEKSYLKALYRSKGLYLYKDASGVFRASLEKVESNGYLHLRTEDGELRSYAFKEVEFLN